MCFEDQACNLHLWNGWEWTCGPVGKRLYSLQNYSDSSILNTGQQSKSCTVGDWTWPLDWINSKVIFNLINGYKML